MATTEEIRLRVSAETAEASAELDRLSKKVGGLDGSLKDISSTSKTSGKSIAQLAQDFFFMNSAVQQGLQVFKWWMKVTEESEKAEKQLQARLVSTAHAAGLTADEIKNMATELQKVTTYDDEAILGGQNLLLTFTKIGKEVFPQATEAMLDLSTALGQDVKSSAIQLGKALNDPIQGVLALRRVGVQLSDQQEEQIKKFMKLNDVVSAQKIL